MYLILLGNVNKTVCLISSHIYLYMSAYLSDDPKPNEILYKVDIYFEIFFAISMAFEFITEFIPSPGYQAIRDPTQIA
jgi:hypothetical protein